ncbi:GIY-YIG nuclease family protein [Marinobacter salarius]|uniref:GIY-YIG nuclease family protein n=1 Tax=Marinobacter salarius TaxID=1420917 RepID=UPI00273C9A0C|nr:GIY-YIG nuclease family protein [Marinobacter salarius]MDP4532874.1 GIY-YIG nuclease family protein [Marinobacter salarius]
MVPREFFNLDEIFQDDDQGLLDSRGTNKAPGQVYRLREGFAEINGFVDEHGQVPSVEGGQLERRLARRLAAICKDRSKTQVLAQDDRYDLLGRALEHDAVSVDEDFDAVSENVTSLDDILADSGGLLDSEAQELFEERHIQFGAKKNTPDEIAQRTPCQDFDRFEGLFRGAKSEIREGHSETVRFARGAQIQEGDFFILDGVMCLVDKIGEKNEGSVRSRHNPRIRVVFDNETESNLLLHSFARALYKDPNGRRILMDPDRVFEKMQGLSHHDRRKGVLYILSSRSTNLELAAMKDLYKIGYTEEALEKRIIGAQRSSTYLEAPVTVEATYDCYGVNPRAVERLVHAMLSSQKLNVTLTDHQGRRYRPREWFCVDLETAKAVVERIADGTISNYRIDGVSGRLVAKSRHYARDSDND